MTLYIVADLAPGYDALKTPYWRTMGVFNSLALAKGFAFPMSIITEWSDHDLAFKVHRSRVLSGNYKVIP